MILYTLAPLAEAVFPSFQPPGQEDPRPSFVCSISGGFVQGTRTARGIRVTRVISTDPKTYLSKEWDLGAEIAPQAFAPIPK